MVEQGYELWDDYLLRLGESRRPIQRIFYRINGISLKGKDIYYPIEKINN